MRQFFIVGDQMCNIDITVVLLDEHVFTDLVTKSRGSTKVSLLIQCLLFGHTDR